MMIIQGKPIATSGMTYDDKMMEAIGYVTAGNEKKDINRQHFYMIYNQPMLFSKYSDNEKAKDLLLDLKTSKELSAKIQVQEDCFSADPLKSLFKNCKPACAWAKKKIKQKKWILFLDIY